MHGLAVGDTAQQDQGQRQLGPELAGVPQQVGLPVWVFAQKLLAGHPHAPADGGFECAGELLERRVTVEQVHRVDQGTARRQLDGVEPAVILRSEEPTSELQSLMRISYAVFCLKKKN